MKMFHAFLYAGLAIAALAHNHTTSVDQSATRRLLSRAINHHSQPRHATTGEQVPDEEWEEEYTHYGTPMGTDAVSHEEEAIHQKAGTDQEVPAPQWAAEAMKEEQELDGAMALASGKDDVSIHGKDDVSIPPLAAVADMEAAVTDLVLHVGSNSGMAASVSHLQDLIKKTMLPKIQKAHEANQMDVDKMAQQVKDCDDAKKSMEKAEEVQKETYLSSSPLHKSCRVREAVLRTEADGCSGQVKHEREIMALKCDASALYEKSWGAQAKNSEIVKKADGETPAVYMQRLHLTYCSIGQGGKSFYERYLELDKSCTEARKRFQRKKRNCGNAKSDYAKKKAECDSIQGQMDDAACNRAVLAKDACEKYASCYSTKKMLFMRGKKVALKTSEDRKSEYRALKRMECLIDKFKGGKIKSQDVDACKALQHDTSHLTLKFGQLGEQSKCYIPDRYPATAAYKKAEFAPLPALAKGSVDAYACHGVEEINVAPKAGSPKSCNCERVALDGPYSPGPLVKCTGCIDVSRSEDRDSCPEGTKIFSPRSKRDWTTFLSSAGSLRAPNFIVDVTRPQDGCGGCADNSMNSEVVAQSSWVTKDGSPWWLRSTKYKFGGSYGANCYFDMFPDPVSSSMVAFKGSASCEYHSSSYYCQKKMISTEPKRGSPPGCACSQVELTGRYSPGVLVKCVKCLRVYRSTEKDSCPDGMKIFSPRSREDWMTILNSVKPLRSPQWIIDITRPQNGCAGCTSNAMNFEVPEQATWRAQDGSPWWLRSVLYNEPNGDYKANCYMDLWKTPGGPNSITFNDKRCDYSSDSYYCQPRQAQSR